jgi:hypothetical protein
LPKQPRTPYDIKLSDEKREGLAIWLSEQLDNALNARSTSEKEIAYWHTLYEQGRTRGAGISPWPEAADLTSPIGTEKVDALRSRIVRTIFSEAPFVVEGWGDAAARAPFVEEFTNWQVEAIGFQGVFSKGVHNSLIEKRGVIEVYEDTIRRPIRKQIRAGLQLGPDGSPMIGEDMQPVLAMDPMTGKYAEVPDVDPMTQQPIPSAEVVIDDYEMVSHGPCVRAIAYRDYLQLPGHAKERGEVWGHAKRFYRSLDALNERVKSGYYDKKAVEEIGTEDERASDTTPADEQKPVAPKEGGLAEKELFEVTFLQELDKTGYRWFVATVHKDKRQLLRLNYDDIGKPRYFSLVPFPRPDSTEGYSFIGEKLITTIEENTAWRNMLADRGSMEVQGGWKKQAGALWDPDEQPMGPRTVITVRSMDEVQPIEIPQMTAPARERIIDTERQAEKLAGMSDIASGSQPNEDRTLGETQLVAANSEVRIDEVVRNIQETLEEIAQVLHVMWKRALGEMDEGMEMPTSVLSGLENRGLNVAQYLPNKRFTVSMMEGAFRFKPKGSVETADKPRQQRLFAEGLQALASIIQFNPMIGAIAQQPAVAKALVERWIYLYGGGIDKAAFLGPRAMQMLQMQMQTPGAIPGMPGPQAPLQPGQEPPAPPEQPGPPQMGTPA